MLLLTHYYSCVCVCGGGGGGGGGGVGKINMDALRGLVVHFGSGAGFPLGYCHSNAGMVLRESEKKGKKRTHPRSQRVFQFIVLRGLQ